MTLLENGVKLRLMALTQREVARMLGVSEPRVSQLKTEGKLTDLSPEGVERFLEGRKAKEKERLEYKQREDDARRERHEAIVQRLDTLNRNVLILASALGAKGLADTLLR